MNSRPDRADARKLTTSMNSRESVTAAIGLIMHALQPEVIHAHNRRAVAEQNALDPVCARPGAAGALMEQGMGWTNGPLVSPGMFRDLCFPYLKERVQHARRFSPQVVFHCCGKMIPIIDQFIEAGVDCYPCRGPCRASGSGLGDLHCTR